MKADNLYEGQIQLDNYKLDCFVLQDGTHMLSAAGMQKALGMVDTAKDDKQIPGTTLHLYLDQTLLDKHLDGKTIEDFEPLMFEVGKEKIPVFEAAVLIELCKAFITAKRSAAISPEQEPIVAKATEIMAALAGKDIKNLIDKATGYVPKKEGKALSFGDKMMQAMSGKPRLEE